MSSQCEKLNTKKKLLIIDCKKKQVLENTSLVLLQLKILFIK